MLCIKDVLKLIGGAGFTIVATVCGQDSANKKAIKTVQLDTDRARNEKNLTPCTYV